MPLMLTPEHTRRIRESVPIEAVVSQYVKLQPDGADSLRGICPFHKEKTPSFKVHPKAGYCKCFGCGISLDAIGFLQRIDNLSFPAAVRSLADQFGISLDGIRQVSKADMNKARELTAECEWWWRRMRRWMVAEQHSIVGCEKRAEAFLAARLEEEDTDGTDYAFWWLVNAERLYQVWERRVRMIDRMAPMEAMRIYLTVRGKVRPVYRAHVAEGEKLRAVLMAAIRADARRVA